MMGPEYFFAGFPIIGVLSLVAGVGFLLGAIQDARATKSNADIVRRVYTYLVSFVTALIACFALIILIDTGLRAWIFTRAASQQYQSPPPTPFLTTMIEDPKGSIPISSAPASLSCDEDCTITDQQRTELSGWVESYRQWEQGTETRRQQAQQTVAGLSFLIAGGVVYVIHWRMAQKDRKRRTSGEPLMVRSTYLWAMAFVWLLTLVISGGFMINTALKKVVPGASDTSVSGGPVSPVAYRDPAASAIVQSIKDCAGKCELDEAVVTYADRFENDMTVWQARQNAASPFATGMATTVPFVLVSLPLFLYHFVTVRREGTQQPGTDTPPTPNA